MKKLIAATIVTCVATFAGVKDASAIHLPGWERPISAAEMKIIKSDGPFRYAREATLTMTRRDGARRPTGITLNVDHVSYAFRITAIRPAGCGSFVFSAVYPAVSDPRALVEPFRLTLVDHRDRVCLDLQPNLWQARVQNVAAQLELEGNPHPVYTIQHD